MFEVTRAQFQKSTNTCVISHFFDRRGGNVLQHSTIGILRSLLYQLGVQHPACLAAFRGYTHADLQLLKSSDTLAYSNTLKSSLKGIFSSLLLAPQRTIIFVDALDECDSGDAIYMGYFLAQLTREAHDNGVQLDICISRREYPSITVKGSLEISMEMYNEADIQSYMHQRLELTNIASSDQELLLRSISQRSNGIFLWVYLVIEGILKDIERGENIKYILKRTESLPKTLEDLYKQIVTNMDPENREMALRLFQWAILATGRLRIREWHHILAFVREKPPASLKEWKDSDYYTETDAQLERRIRDPSQGLVEVKVAIDGRAAASDSESLIAGAGSLDSTAGESRVVQPIHETVTDFFIHGGANLLRSGGFVHDFLGEGHLSIARMCLAYIDIAELDGLVSARRCLQPVCLSPTPDIAPRSAAESISDMALRPRTEDTPSIDPWDISNYIFDRAPRMGAEDTPDTAPRGRAEYTQTMQSLYRSQSVTSFMSSASSHSRKYCFEDPDPPSDPDPTGVSAPRPPTSEEFAALFPSSNLLSIQHDGFNPEQGLNLRVDSLADGRPCLQLFHLQMFDTFQREFSLRSYDSNPPREVCRTRRGDGIPRITDSIYLDFPPSTLFQQVTVKMECHGGQLDRSYRFIYQEAEYRWQPATDNSFHLLRGCDEDPLVHINPVVRSLEEITADKLIDAWVPRCQMQLVNNTDWENEYLADVVMATALTVLVDYTMKDKPDYPKWEAPKLISTPSPPPLPSSMGSTAPSVVSQTLEDYPALTSYVLNRVFVHARAGLALGANPREVLRKLVWKNAWTRWYLLQEDVSDLQTWRDMLESQGLYGWVDIMQQIFYYDEAFGARTPEEIFSGFDTDSQESGEAD
ncbi:hypothetical protein SAMD00023353_0200430 [Rosellinia necatrix]|uniref:Nephrocystin 3-like N-terminal domain-containing protein n=1 Tax=Rosellinia necatrix TaxID=77044 RepID=A0A1S8A569_ROSNE|nr:hypothetical protein SAMD00023353_0200430 [Rosellinia necatrix]